MFGIFKYLPIILLFSGCSTSSVEVEKQTKGVKGEFVHSMQQHPIMSMNQLYFRPDGDKYGEWIVDWKEEPIYGKKVIIYGDSDSIDLGGKSGTKMSYGGTIFYIERVEYLD